MLKIQIPTKSTPKLPKHSNSSHKTPPGFSRLFQIQKKFGSLLEPFWKGVCGGGEEGVILLKGHGDRTFLKGHMVYFRFQEYTG